MKAMGLDVAKTLKKDMVLKQVNRGNLKGSFVKDRQIELTIFIANKRGVMFDTSKNADVGFGNHTYEYLAENFIIVPVKNIEVVLYNYNVYQDGTIDYATAIEVSYVFKTKTMAKIFYEVSQNIVGLKSSRIKGM